MKQWKKITTCCMLVLALVCLTACGKKDMDDNMDKANDNNAVDDRVDKTDHNDGVVEPDRNDRDADQNKEPMTRMM